MVGYPGEEARSATAEGQLGVIRRPGLLDKERIAARHAHAKEERDGK